MSTLSFGSFPQASKGVIASIFAFFRSNFVSSKRELAQMRAVSAEKSPVEITPVSSGSATLLREVKSDICVKTRSVRGSASVQEQVIDILAIHLAVRISRLKIVPEAKLQDLKINIFDLRSMAWDLDDKFSREMKDVPIKALRDENFAKLETVGDLIALVELAVSVGS